MKKVTDGAGHEANAAQVSDGTQENITVSPGSCDDCGKRGTVKCRLGWLFSDDRCVDFAQRVP